MLDLSKPHIVFTGGGTGGHLFPGLAVADDLAAVNFSKSFANIDISFVGSGKPFERNLVTAAGFPYYAIPCRPMPKNPLNLFRFLTDNTVGYCAARRYLKARQVSAVVGLGGYVSAAACRAAISLKIPLVLLEQNVIPGKVTRWLAPYAEQVCIAFKPLDETSYNGASLHQTGIPLRSEFLKGGPIGQSSLISDSDEKLLLILGGSQGAGSLNQYLPKALYKLKDQLAGWRIVHQTGAGKLEETQAIYNQLGLSAIVVSYIDNMADIMRHADLVVSRAGGTSIAELCHLQIPSVIVPLINSADDHQRKNAHHLAAAAACALVDQKADSEPLDMLLQRALRPLLKDSWKRNQMAHKMERFSNPRANEEVISTILNCLNQSKKQVA